MSWRPFSVPSQVQAIDPDYNNGSVELRLTFTSNRRPGPTGATRAIACSNVSLGIPRDNLRRTFLRSWVDPRDCSSVSLQ
jgi:hypothetical protein